MTFAGGLPAAAQKSAREALAETMKPLHDANVKAMAEYTCNMAMINLERQNALDLMNLKTPPPSRYDAMIAKTTECINTVGPRALAYNYRAEAYFAKGNIQAALADFETAISTHKTEKGPIVGLSEIYESRADLFIRAGERAKAEADLREAVRLDPSDYTAKDKLDNLDRKIAEERKKSILANPRTAQDFIVVGNDSWNRGKIDEAIVAFDRSLALAPSAAGHLGRAKALRDRNSFDAALAELNKALALTPADPKTLDWRGRIHLDLKRWDAAISDFSAVLLTATAKDKAYLLNVRGQAYAGKHSYDLALKDHDASLAAAGDDAFGKINAFTGKGDVLSAQRKNPEAIAAYNAAVAAAGTDYFAKLNLITAWLGRGRLYAAEGKTDLAKADFNEILKIAPKSPEAKAEMAKLNAPASASAQAAAPRTAEQWADDGRRQGANKDYDAAIKSFTECLKLRPDAFACLAFRGGIYGLKGDTAASKADFDKALQLGQAMQAPIYFIRAMMFTELGKKVDAIADFRSVLKIDPNNAQAKEALQRLGVQQ